MRETLISLYDRLFENAIKSTPLYHSPLYWPEFETPCGRDDTEYLDLCDPFRLAEKENTALTNTRAAVDALVANLEQYNSSIEIDSDLALLISELAVLITVSANANVALGAAKLKAGVLNIMKGEISKHKQALPAFSKFLAKERKNFDLQASRSLKDGMGVQAKSEPDDDKSDTSPISFSNQLEDWVDSEDLENGIGGGSYGYDDDESRSSLLYPTNEPDDDKSGTSPISFSNQPEHWVDSGDLENGIGGGSYGDDVEEWVRNLLDPTNGP